MSDTMQPRVIGRRLFTDGTERDVYEDPDGRQWVTGYDRERVCSVWLLPTNEPMIVSCER